jgi:hypothetical protein
MQTIKQSSSTVYILLKKSIRPRGDFHTFRHVPVPIVLPRVRRVSACVNPPPTKSETTKKKGQGQHAKFPSNKEVARPVNAQAEIIG